MEKTININGKDIKFIANAANVFEYRDKFGGDMMTEITRITQATQNGASLPEGAIESFSKMAYIMAKEADNSVPDDIKEWLKNFEMFDIINAMPQLVELWTANIKGLSTQKKSGGKSTGK